jgi:hypothetical protein
MFFIDLFWVASGIFTVGLLFYRNKNEGIFFNLSPFLLHIFLTLLILYTPIEGMFIGNLEFIYGSN